MSDLIKDIQDVEQAHMHALEIIYRIMEYSICEDCFRQMRDLYHELHQRAIELGDTAPWIFPLPEDIENARLKLTGRFN